MGEPAAAARGPRTASERRLSAVRPSTEERLEVELEAEAAGVARRDTRSPAVLLTNRMIVPLVAVRFTSLSGRATVEGTSYATLVVLLATLLTG